MIKKGKTFRPPTELGIKRLAKWKIKSLLDIWVAGEFWKVNDWVCNYYDWVYNYYNYAHLRLISHMATFLHGQEKMILLIPKRSRQQLIVSSFFPPSSDSFLLKLMFFVVDSKCHCEYFRHWMFMTRYSAKFSVNIKLNISSCTQKYDDAIYSTCVFEVPSYNLWTTGHTFIQWRFWLKRLDETFPSFLRKIPFIKTAASPTSPNHSILCTRKTIQQHRMPLPSYFSKQINSNFASNTQIHAFRYNWIYPNISHILVIALCE